MKFCDFLDEVSLKRSNITFTSPVRDNSKAEINPLSPGSPINNLNNSINQQNTTNNNSDISPINKNSALLFKKEKTDFSHIKKPFRDMERHFRFYIPSIISEEISSMKMKDLVQLFRNELLIFDIEKCNGIVFNLPDIIQCSMFGICGIANNQADLLNIFEKTINLLKNKIISKEKNFKAKHDLNNKYDSIDFFDLTSKIKSYINSCNHIMLKK